MHFVSKVLSKISLKTGIFSVSEYVLSLQLLESSLKRIWLYISQFNGIKVQRKDLNRPEGGFSNNQNCKPDNRAKDNILNLIFKSTRA